MSLYEKYPLDPAAKANESAGSSCHRQWQDSVISHSDNNQTPWGRKFEETSFPSSNRCADERIGRPNTLCSHPDLAIPFIPKHRAIRAQSHHSTTGSAGQNGSTGSVHILV